MRPETMRRLIVVAVAVVAVCATAVYGAAPPQTPDQQRAEQQWRAQQEQQRLQQQQEQQRLQQEQQRQQQQQQQQQGTTGTTTNTSKPATAVFIVIKVTDTKGDVSYDVILSSALVERQKQTLSDFKTALDKWKKDKADAAAGKRTFDGKQPVQGKVERVETDPPGFKTQELAKAEADRLTKKLAELKKGAAATIATADTTAKPAPHTPPTGKVVKAPDTTDENQKTGDKGP